MIDTKFDTAYAAGRFDLSLNILDGNPQMFNLMGVDSYYSIYKMLSDDEQKKVAATAAKCLETPELSYDECVHITFDGKLCCYILTIMLVPGGGAYDIKLINVSNTENRVNELNRRIITAREYIALTGEAIFKYDYDTQRFHLYYVNQQQNVTIFDQNFEEWITQMLAENRIAQEDMETFEAFCAAGGDGTVSGNAMIIREHYARLWDAISKKDYDLAVKYQRRTNTLNAVLCEINNIAAYKVVLKDEGIIRTAKTRQPMENLTPAQEEALLSEMKRLDYKKVLI